MRRALLVSLGLAALGHAQQPAPPASEPLRLGAFLVEVAKANPALTAQRLTLPVAEAQLVIARVFPDPALTGGLSSFDLSNVGAQNAVAASLSVPLEWPGKRAARIALSEANLSVAAADFEDFARTVRAQAANAYVDAVFAQRVLNQKRAAVDSLRRVVELNEKRLHEGAASEIVVLQARVEARRLEGELVTAAGEARALRLMLEEQMGRPSHREVLSEVAPELVLSPRTFELDALVASALEHRPDRRSRDLAVAAAKAQLRLAHANRGPDFAAGVGWQYYFPGAAGSAFASPGYHTASLQLTAPLPFSRIYDGELRAATAQQRVAQAQRDQTALRVETEVRASFIRYEAARARLAQFDQDLLADSDRLLQMAQYSFEQGASRLFELLSAQRSWIDLHLAYEAALADHARALIALETAAGEWSLNP